MGVRSGRRRKPQVLSEQYFKLLSSNWRADIITLDFIAAVKAQIIKLVFGFYTFRNNSQVQIFGHCNDCTYNRRTVRISHDFTYKCQVDFKFIKGKAPQITQTGIAGAEV